jgi:hypothetical protein
MSTKTDKKITELYLLISGLESSVKLDSSDHLDSMTIDVFCDAAYRVLLELKLSIKEETKNENRGK